MAASIMFGGKQFLMMSKSPSATPLFSVISREVWIRLSSGSTLRPGLMMSEKMIPLMMANEKIMEKLFET